MTTKNIIELIIIIVAGCTLLWAIATVFRYIWMRNWLRVHGERISATISSVRKGRARSGYRYYLTARWSDPHTDKEYLFFGSISSQAFLSYKEGQTVPVLIDPQDPARHYLVDAA